MKRKQYKILSEKYQSIQENNKDEIMTGLKVMINLSKKPLYMVTQQFHEWRYELIGPYKTSLEEVKEKFFDDPLMPGYYDASDEPMISYADFEARMNSFEVYTLKNAEEFVSFSRNLKELVETMKRYENEFQAEIDNMMDQDDNA